MTDKGVEILLALGSNQGDRRANLRAAIEALPPAIAVAAQSRVYETAPMYVADQPAFLNMALRGTSALTPENLLARLKAIEAAVGRVETFRNGPRAIDLDILYYGDRIVDAPGLEIPHPRIAERAFVLIPAADVAPERRDPRTGRTVAEMLAAAPGRETVRPASPPTLG
ncbi:MAG: 2-amino-4-hydroxy-6-hydroxymethyldihydropteridine diphosphokinase [Marivibrio sp.]|uniref:2-amino-4-hydroxy-6- hydroxymethyldihydropteridine diphosphokinase n=1 Tax=Marivibrio sp. TaxID=2039719 RepID=UPI0032EB6DFB